MKYCSKCGAELYDDAVICVKCGCPVENNIQFSPQAPTYAQSGTPFPPQSPTYAQNTNTFAPQPLCPVQKSGVTTAVKVFLILGTVLMALYTFCIGLAWCLPMTLSYFGKVKRGEPIGTGFKVCTLIFVSLVAGILMLCDNEH